MLTRLLILLLSAASLYSPALAAKPYRCFDATCDPPARYAGPYEGELLVEKLHPSKIPARCHEMGTPYHATQTGCSLSGKDERGLLWCVVIIPIIPVRRPKHPLTGKRVIMKPDAVLRHELGHCNGWRH